MEREFPKNVRQIGNVCDEPKIYVEDYVDTYLNQLKVKAQEKPVGAILTGELLSMDGQAVVYIAGALELREIETGDDGIVISEEVWQQLEEEKARFFSGQDMVGWCLIETGQPMGLIRSINRIHEKLFEKEHTVFVWRDAADADEAVYASKFGELMQIGGYYIFYEKNPSMQNYMINARKKIGVTPCEMVEDRAAKDFRNAVREKKEYRDHRQNARVTYAMSVMLVVIVLVIGISTINNYDKMESVQDSLETLSRAVARPPSQEETVSGGTAGGETAGVGESGDKAADTGEKKTLSAGKTGDGAAGAGGKETISGGAGAEGSAGSALEGFQSADLDPADGASESAGNGDRQGEESGEEPETSAAGSIPETADVQSQSAPEEGHEVHNYYIVQGGDTLDGISRKFYGTMGRVDDICRLNGLEDGNLIIIGQKLLLP